MHLEQYMIEADDTIDMVNPIEWFKHQHMSVILTNAKITRYYFLSVFKHSLEVLSCKVSEVELLKNEYTFGGFSSLSQNLPILRRI